MSLHVDALRFEDFRNHAFFELGGLSGTTVFVGPNAAGKTNIIEGIQLLTACGSFRNSKSADLVRWGQGSARLAARMLSDSRDLRVSVEVRPGVRTYSLNGKKKAVHDLQGLLPSVVFSPDDLSLVKGGQAERRSALDLVGCQLSRNHRIIKRDYEKLVRHKNALLKADSPALLLEAVNDMLLPTAVQLFLYRQALAANLGRRIKSAYEALTDEAECVEVSYVASWEDDSVLEASKIHPYRSAADKQAATDSCRRAFQRRASEEMARRRSVVGPHADRLEFFIDGRNATLFGSQGQQRSIVLAWKIAELELAREMSGENPVLLLDDVMSELDAHRRAALVKLISRGAQTFITATDTSFFDSDMLSDARVIALERGMR